MGQMRTSLTIQCSWPFFPAIWEFYYTVSAFPQRYRPTYTTLGSLLTVNRYSSTLSPSSSSAASSSPDYPCLHPFCDHRSKRPSDLDRHMTKHFPPPSSKTFDCPELGCDRIGDFGFCEKVALNAHISNYHDKDVSTIERAARLFIKRRASPAEEDLPCKRTKRFRGVMAPAISEVGHSDPKVNQGMNLKLIQRPPHEWGKRQYWES